MWKFAITHEDSNQEVSKSFPAESGAPPLSRGPSEVLKDKGRDLPIDRATKAIEQLRYVHTGVEIMTLISPHPAPTSL